MTAIAVKTGQRYERRARRTNWPATVVLVLGAIYTCFPILWIFIAVTKSTGELFSTSTMLPSFNGGLRQNFHDLFAYEHGVFLLWGLNSVIYSVGGGFLSTAIAALAGYALGKYRFRGSVWIFRGILSAILLPGVLLAVPQFLLFAQFHFTNNYAAVILPGLASPFAIYLCKVYAEAAIPNDLMDAARIDGAGEWRIFWSVGSRLMIPAFVTVFMLGFIGIWNNFLLPFLMLNSDRLFPLTLGLFGLVSAATGENGVSYGLIIAGAVFSLVPLAALFIVMQRYLKLDLMSGGLRG